MNGIPLFTFELKNPWTHQTARKDGIEQYKSAKRNPKDVLLSFGRCLAHFVVDKNEVFFTTKLALEKTYFMPFNKELPDGQGAGNPVNPDGGYKTASLWEQINEKHSGAMDDPIPYDGNMAMDSFEKIVRIADKAVATSGNYRRYYLTESGQKVAHTISPKTGRSVVSTLLSATVIAHSCTEADAAATMLMSLGATEEATRIAEQCHEEYGWDYYLIFAGDEDYRIECSEGLK